MQYALIIASAALAQFAHAHGIQHGRFHKRAMETVVDVTYVTEYVTVTAGAPAASASANENWWHSWSGKASSSSTESTIPVASSSAAPVEYSSAATSSSATTFSTSAASTSTSVASSTSIPSSSPAAYSSSAAPSPSTYAASSSSSAAASPSGITTGNLTPNGKKAGLSGYVGIQEKQAFSDLSPYISWYSDYTPNTPTSNGVTGIGMLWGADGSTCGDVMTERLSTFQGMSNTPDIFFGFYEPDCTCPMSSDMTTTQAASDWDSLIAPLKAKGTVLGSPSMCKQKDEDFLTPFNSSISVTWDVTSIHINKPDLEGAKEDVEYYVSTYGKPIWVSEFACVDDANGWAPCTDQGTINSFISDLVTYFEGNDDVVAYGPSNGAGLGDVWPLTDDNGDLTSSGQAYLSAIKAL